MWKGYEPINNTQNYPLKTKTTPLNYYKACSYMWENIPRAYWNIISCFDLWRTDCLAQDSKARLRWFPLRRLARNRLFATPKLTLIPPCGGALHTHRIEYSWASIEPAITSSCREVADQIQNRVKWSKSSPYKKWQQNISSFVWLYLIWPGLFQFPGLCGRNYLPNFPPSYSCCVLWHS